MRAKPGVLGLSADCRLSLVTEARQFHALAGDWRALEKSCAQPPTVFATFDWCATWADIYCSGSAEAPTLHVLAGYDKDQLVFIFPLMRSRQMGLRTLTWLSEPFGQYGDVLCAAGQQARMWIAAALQFLQRLRDIDLLYLRHIRADGALALNGMAWLSDARVPEQAPFLDLSQFQSEEDYDARYTGAQRKRRKKIRKGLEQLGTVSFRTIPPGSMADAAMATAIAEKNAWLSERGRLNRVLGCPQHLAFLKALSRRRGNVSVVITELTAGPKPVSWEIGFRLADRHFAYITSHVNAHTDLSPGRLHMDLSQRKCLVDGMAVFDLMVPNDAHKESWSSAKVMTNDVYLPLTWSGMLVGHGYLRSLRPLLRTIYYWLEPRALSWLRNPGLGRRPSAPPEAP